MALRLVVALAFVALVASEADQSAHVRISHGGQTSSFSSHRPHSPAPHSPAPHRPSPHSPAPHARRPAYTPEPTYGERRAPASHRQPAYGKSAYHVPTTPAYKPTPAYHKPSPSYPPRAYHEPAYTPAPYGHSTPAPYGPRPSHYEETPKCANGTKTYCIHDYEYPRKEIMQALEYNKEKVLSMYADVADLDTELSVYGLNYLKEETYLCPSDTEYIQPLRALNTEYKWRFIVNNVDAHYQTFTQTVRVEECLASYGDQSCPLVPECYESKCLQKSVYHRFLTYDPYDQYFPFAIESFKLPASCACLLGGFEFKAPAPKYH